MQGIVTVEGTPTNGAEVKVCCTRAHTATQALFGRTFTSVNSSAGVYHMVPPAGNYRATASWTDAMTGITYNDEKIVALEFQQIQRVDFDLKPPPDSDREIIVKGHMDIVSRVAFGHDWWGHPDFEMPHVRLGPYGRPGTPDADMGLSGSTKTSQALSDYGSVGVTVDCRLDATTGTIRVNWHAAIFDGDDSKVSTGVTDFPIPKDGSESWTVDLATAGPWPDRAHIVFTVENARQR
jgi:hypothetical protein